MGLEKRGCAKGRGWRMRGCGWGREGCDRVGLEEEKGCEGTGGVGLEKGKGWRKRGWGWRKRRGVRELVE